jgi:hypothetical protein
MRKLLFLLMLSLSGLIASAQETRVTGKVINAAGEPVAGASVIVKGQDRGHFNQHCGRVYDNCTERYNTGNNKYRFCTL